jgi:DNA-binding NarL/FixJ family response regulator
VLVASDSPVVRAGLRAILDSSGDSDVAGECALGDAPDLAATLRPDVVLLDLTGDEPEGLAVLWRVAAAAPEAGVVVLSGDPAEARARAALEAGARAYLLRDVSPEEMLISIRAAHQGLTVLHPATARALLSRPPAVAPDQAGEVLTARELEVLRLLAQGLPSKTIATRLHISENTVKFHVGSILGKLGSASRTEAVSVAIRRGLIAL